MRPMLLTLDPVLTTKWSDSDKRHLLNHFWTLRHRDLTARIRDLHPWMQINGEPCPKARRLIRYGETQLRRSPAIEDAIHKIDVFLLWKEAGLSTHWQG